MGIDLSGVGMVAGSLALTADCRRLTFRLILDGSVDVPLNPEADSIENGEGWLGIQSCRRPRRTKRRRSMRGVLTSDERILQRYGEGFVVVW